MNGLDNPDRLGYTLLTAYCAHLTLETKEEVSALISAKGKMWLSKLSDEALLMETSSLVRPGWSGVSHCVVERPLDTLARRLCEASSSFLPASRIDTVTGPLISADPTSPVVTTVTATCTPQVDLYGVKQEATLQIVRLLLS